jgi:hypothetical protein
MNSLRDLDPFEPTPDEMLAESFSADPIGVTFAGGRHETDLLSFLEHAKRMAGEVC